MRNILVVLLVISLALSGYLYYQNRVLAKQDYLALFFVRSTPTNFLLVPTIAEVSEPATPEKALELLLAGSETEDLVASVPSGTKLLGITINDQVATVDFSPEIQTNFIGGAQLEGHLIDAIWMTLTQFPTIDHVEILIAGDKIDSIGGHISLEYYLP